MNKLGRYEIRELIGEGAMAKVYSAYDPELQRSLAIKVMHSEFVSDPEYRRRFLQEAKGAGTLSHQNIVTVYDAGVDHTNHPYLAMELVEGKTLSELIEQSDQIPIETVIDIGIQLARALDYAHKKGVVHRDIKPSNIMLLKDSNSVKVTDFGVCRISNSDATQRTQVGTVLGTYHWMSPEQVQGQEEVDGRSDIFSAGVVLYQMLSKTLPFQGNSVITVALKITTEEPAPPIENLRGDIPPSLRRVLDLALKKQPEKRYQTGAALADALVSVARELQETGQEDSRRRIPIRVRWAAAMAALVGITMAISGFLLHQRLHESMMELIYATGSNTVQSMVRSYALPLWNREYETIEGIVENMAAGNQFSHLVVVDDQQIIRGSSEIGRVNAIFQAPHGKSVTRPPGDPISIVRTTSASEEPVVDFGLPVVMDGRPVGSLHLGVRETPVLKVAKLTLVLMASLAAITIVAVATGVYLLTLRLSARLIVLRNALQELEQGRYDYRIALPRKDEIGSVYVAFDRAAQALDQRHNSAAKEPDRPNL